ncbi:MAG: AAA family ATPase [Synergistaceae bacterium]|nr:AAA family ATPase [Synergistaceae bacterium]
MDIPNIPEYDIELQFRAFLDSLDAEPAGFEPLIFDSEIHRYSIKGERPTKKSGAYCVFRDGGLPAGWAQNWKLGCAVSWCFDCKGLHEEERKYFDTEQFRAQKEADRKEREAREIERANRMAQWCSDRCKGLPPAPEDHPYLKAKQIFPYGALIENGGAYTDQNALAITLTDIHGNIRGLQYILPNGEKRYEPGISLKGVFWSIALDTLSGTDDDIILLGEGFATMAKLYELTGFPAVAGLSCHGLKPVAEALHSKFPKARIIITADNDKDTEKLRDFNPGIDAAKAIVKARQANAYIFPTFNENEQGSDWDDFALLHGDDNTKLLLQYKIRDALIPPNIKAMSDNSQLEVIIAQHLRKKIFPPVKWAVQGFLPAGLSILAGGPKVGKSILALHLSIGVAIGGCVLGHINVQKGEVLYLALEDTQRRLQDRLESSYLVDQDTDLCGLYIVTRIPRQHLGGLDYIRYWLHEHKQARLVIIDTLQMFRKQLSGKGSMYSEDYEVVSQIKRVADEADVPFLIIHHLKKGMEGDWLSEISGSQGIAGAADTIFSLKRERGSTLGTLHRTGRDVEEKDFILKLDPYGWTLQGEADEFTTPEWKRQILDFLKDNTTVTPMQLAEAVSIPLNTAQQNLRRLAKEGYIVKKGYGTYGLPDKQ